MSTLPRSKCDGAASSNGFRATLNGMSVADLVQMNCLSGQTSSVKVASELRTGWLHFAHGTIVHASTGSLVGDLAVLEILAWETGSFEPVSGVAPERQTVETQWQNLLLLAAHKRDENGRAAAPASARHAVRAGLSVTQTRVSEVPTVSTEEFLRAHIDANGNIVSSQGNVEDLVAQGAYAAELAQMIAEGLGLDRALGLELRESKHHTLLSINQDGEVEIARGNSEEQLAALRRVAQL